MFRYIHIAAHRGFTTILLAVAALCLPAAVWAQTVASPASTTPAAGLINRTIYAIGYKVNGGSTTVDFKNTGVVGAVTGTAKVEAKPAVTTIETDIQGLTAPTSLGAEFLTYVLWAVSPEGHAINVAEVLFDKNGNSKLKATTQLSTFSLFVTAEPYSAVRQPSEVLILENALRKNTKGTIFAVNNYPLMKRSEYQKLGNPLALSLDLKTTPLQVYEARNAVDIAKSKGAEKYAPEVFSKAQAGLVKTENALASKANTKEVISLALQTAQSAEDARALTAEREEAERIANEKAAAAATAKAQAEQNAAEEAAVAKAKADAEARRQAELAAAQESAIKAEAAAKEAQLNAQREIESAKAQAAKADADRQRQAAQDLRAQLLAQFNSILQTVDTPRGLVITMADVLFDTGKYNLLPGTNLQLAKLSGIILAHPGLHLSIEGYTDSTGGDAINQKLSEQRANTVRDFLISQGLSPDAVTAKGLGSADPVASNDTAAGRKQNRRVELIVSGEIIGVRIGQ